MSKNKHIKLLVPADAEYLFDKNAPEVADIEPIEDECPEVQTGPSLEKGIVDGCFKLNIRKEPNANSQIVCEVNNGSELSVDVATATDEWYHVITAAGIEGFCMKKFVRPVYHNE